MKGIENFAFGIAFGLAVGVSYGMQHPMTTTPALVTTAPVPTKTAAVEPEKKECERQPVLTVPKFLADCLEVGVFDGVASTLLDAKGQKNIREVFVDLFISARGISS